MMLSTVQRELRRHTHLPPQLRAQLEHVVARCCHVAAGDLDALAQNLTDAFHNLDRVTSASKATVELPKMKPIASEPDSDRIAITTEG